MNDFILGIDAGTSVVKAAIFDLLGNEVNRAARNVPINSPEPHLAEIDMSQVWVAATEAIREVLTGTSVRPEEIAGISVTGQGDGSWMIDPDGKPLGPALLWTDGRAGDIIDGWYEDGTVSKQFAISGAGPYAGTSAALLRWRRDNQPELMKEGINIWCKDWIGYNLTGDISTDPSDPSLSGIDVRTRAWSEEVLEAWGLEDVKHVLPTIRSATDRAGTVTAAAGVTGLREGTPVYKGQMDITASSLGVGVARPGDCMAVIGTAGIVTVATDTLDNGFEPQDVGWVIPHGPDTWIRAMGMNYCTPNLDWFLREFGDAFRAEAAAQQPEGSIFDFLDAKVSNVPLGSGGIIFHGYLAPGGERAPFVRPSARGSFSGITGNHNRYHMLRAVYEGVAYGIRDCLDSIPTRVDTVRMAGGGANSAVWCQIFADVLGRKIVVPSGTEFGAKGAAIVAGVGLGLYESYAQGVDATVNIVREYEPDLAKTAVYSEFFEVYRDIHKSMMPIWDKLQKATRRAAAF